MSESTVSHPCGPDGVRAGVLEISTVDQIPRAQIAELKEAGCGRILEETAAGARARKTRGDRVLDGGETASKEKVEPVQHDMSGWFDARPPKGAVGYGLPLMVEAT